MVESAPGQTPAAEPSASAHVDICVERHGRCARAGRVLARSSLRRGVRHFGRNDARAVLGAHHRAKRGAAALRDVGIDRISDRAKPAADRCEPVGSLFDLSATRRSDRVVDERRDLYVQRERYWRLRRPPAVSIDARRAARDRGPAPRDDRAARAVAHAAHASSARRGLAVCRTGPAPRDDAHRSRTPR